MERLAHFCSRDAADIEGLGPAKLADLHAAGLLATPLDIYRLRQGDLAATATAIASTSTSTSTTDTGDDDNVDVGAGTVPAPSPTLRGRKNWGDRSVSNVLAAVDERRTLPLPRFLYALGVRHVGQQTALDLAATFGSFAALWGYLLGEVKRHAKAEVARKEKEAADAAAAVAAGGEGEAAAGGGEAKKKTKRKKKTDTDASGEPAPPVEEPIGAYLSLSVYHPLVPLTAHPSSTPPLSPPQGRVS